MTVREVKRIAARLGLTAWTFRETDTGRARDAANDVRCLGFATAGICIGEGSTWDEAVWDAIRVIFEN